MLSGSASSTCLRLVVEPINDTAQRLDVTELRVLALETPFLDTQVQTLRVDAQPASLRFADATHAHPENSRELAFEPLTIDGRASLLMQCPQGLRVRVNGHPAGRLSVLSEGDQLQFGDAVLHLVEFMEFWAGPPAADHIGRICGVCRTPVAKNSRVYIHGCGEILHIEDESTPVEQRLECALVADTCPSCQRKISMQTGYNELPEI